MMVCGQAGGSTSIEDKMSLLCLLWLFATEWFRDSLGTKINEKPENRIPIFGRVPCSNLVSELIVNKQRVHQSTCYQFMLVSAVIVKNQ